MKVYDRRGVEISELKIERVSVTKTMTKSSVLYLVIDGCPQVRKEKERRKGSKARDIYVDNRKRVAWGFADVSSAVWNHETGCSFANVVRQRIGCWVTRVGSLVEGTLDSLVGS